MSREIIMVGGGPASGKSAISELRFEMSIEHLAVGDVIRSIGRGAIKSHYTQEIQ